MRKIAVIGLGYVGLPVSKSGHIEEPKEQRQLNGKKVAHLPSPHRLRDTFTTACAEVGLSPYDIDVLTNHRPPKGTVTAGYIRQNIDHLHICQEKVTAHLLERVRKSGKYGAMSA